MTAPWDRRPPAEQARVQARILARWLPLAVGAAPTWRRRAGEVGLDPASLTDHDGLRRLPPARELELLADGPGAPDAVIRPSEDQVKAHAGPSLLGRVAAGVRRQGLTGKRRALLREYQPVALRRAGVAGETLVASSRSDLDRANRVGARAAAVLGLDDRDVLLDAVPTGPGLAAAHVAHLAQGASIPALHARGHGDDLDTVAAAAHLLPASVVVVPVEEALALAAALEGVRRALGRLRRVVTYGPPPDPELRGEIAAAYGRLGGDVEVRAVWAPPLSRTLWAECGESGDGLHTQPDLELLEVVDPLTGAPTDGDGDATVTSLDWHGTALLRLRTGAWIDPPVTEPCPSCGRTVPRVVGELGPAAWQPAVATDDGTTSHVDLRGVAAVLAGREEIYDWRAELRGPDEHGPRDQLVVEVAAQLAWEERTRLEEEIAAACGHSARIAVGVPPGAIRRDVAAVGGVFADLR